MIRRTLVAWALVGLAPGAIGAVKTGSPATVMASQELPPPPEYHNIRDYGLGSQRTVVIAFSAECQPCKESVPFYKRLLSTNGMDGKRNRFIVLSTDGVVPVEGVLTKAGFKPHAIISYPRQSKLRELSDQAPELVILDAAGSRCAHGAVAFRPRRRPRC